ncbi:MAG: TAXI family TRAP transporter solute-binding subunit [Planctomycetota bacterium]
MRKLTRRLLLISAIVIVLAVIATALFLATRTPDPVPISIATATPGGTYLPLGSRLAGILEDLRDTPFGPAWAWQTAGSDQNIDMLLREPRPRANAPHYSEPADRDSADLAFVANTSLAQRANEDPGLTDRIQVLARLYTGVVQVLVRSDSGIGSLADLRGRKVYAGKDKSGTRPIAEGVLNSVGVSEISPSSDSYTRAAEKVLSGELDAAIFASGTPTAAVKSAMQSGACKLLDLEQYRDEIYQAVPDLEEQDIPAYFYENQPEKIHSVGARALLVCRAELDPELAEKIVAALFDHSAELLLGHAKAQDIDPWDAFRPLPKGFRFHPGVRRFREKQKDMLIIATGAIGGQYHKIGLRVRDMLQEAGIETMAIHTDGSRENAWYLQDEETPTLAIMQYDIALDIRGRGMLYEDALVDRLGNEIHLPTLRRIATLHEEKVHILVLKDSLAKQAAAPGAAPTVRDLAECEICVGPEGSGTRLLARRILDIHNLKRGKTRCLGVQEMVDALYNEDIDAGFFVSVTPSLAIRRILNDERIRLVSIDRAHSDELTRSAALSLAEIQPGQYLCLKEGEPPVTTLATTAVLVTTEDVPRDVKKITETIFEGAAFLGIEDVQKKMARSLASLPLHPDAEQVYRDLGLVPTSGMSTLEKVAHALAILVIVLGALKGGLMLSREHTGNRIKGEALSIAIGDVEQDAVARLLNLREETRERAGRRWWKPGQLDESRWRELEDLIDERILKANSILVKQLLGEARRLRDADPSVTRERAAELRRQVWQHAEEGEIKEAQVSMILTALGELGADRNGP